MNPFFDISDDEDLPDNELPLKNLGNQQIYATIGARRGSEFWGTSGTSSKTFYENTTPGHYDRQFAYKLQKWKPIYDIDRLIEHHYKYYISIHKQGDEFLKHMRYVILPMLKKQRNTDVCIDIFEQWLQKQIPLGTHNFNTVTNNTINVGSINAPTQFQQNSDHSVQTQNTHYQKEDVKTAFELIQQDIQHLNEQIRKDFAMEMDYAMIQLERNKEIKPQLSNIGTLIKDIGIGTFTNLLAAPIFELIRPHLGL